MKEAGINVVLSGSVIYEHMVVESWACCAVMDRCMPDTHSPHKQTGPGWLGRAGHVFTVLRSITSLHGSRAVPITNTYKHKHTHKHEDHPKHELLSIRNA